MARPANPQTRKTILQKAEHLIHLRGYQGTSLEDIARSCGMTKANLVHHYGSKEELGFAVLEDKIADYRAKRIADLCAEGDPIGAVRRLFEESAQFYGGNGCKAGCFVGNMALEMSDISERFRKRVSLFFEEWAAGIAACLKRAQDKGLLNPALDCREAADAVVCLYEGAAMMARTRRDASIFARAGSVARAVLTGSSQKEVSPWDPRRPAAAK